MKMVKKEENAFAKWSRKYVKEIRSLGVPKPTAYAWALNTRQPKPWVQALARRAVRDYIKEQENNGALC